MTAIREETNHVFSKDKESTSPSRISFSFNFCQLVDEDSNGIPLQELHQRYPASSSPGNTTSDDFEFGVLDCCRSSCEYAVSSADQLFENGTILPVEMMTMTMKNGLSNNNIQVEQEEKEEEGASCELGGVDDHHHHHQDNYLQPLPFLSPLYSSPVNNNGKKISEMEADDHDKVQSKSTTSSFFRGFKRSNDSSDHHDSNIKNNLSFLFPVPVLPRNCTTSNKTQHTKQKQQQQQFVSPKMVKSSSVSSTFPQRSASLLRKSRSSSGGSYYGGAIKVSPVLHFTTPNCISKATTSASFLGCFFNHNGNKDKKNTT